MHPAIQRIQIAIEGTKFEGDLYLVGGAVRDELLGLSHDNDFDLVTRGSAAELADLLYEKGASSITPVTYDRFGTAMVRVEGIEVELVTARRESYDSKSRKPTVEPATYTEDALRRDFTANTLMRNIGTGEVVDPLGSGLADLEARILRTPCDPDATFIDDPLRMLRAVRFRWKLGFEPAEGLYASIQRNVDRLKIISWERIRDELMKMLDHPTGPEALSDLMSLGLFQVIAPELVAMVDCEQGRYHHLDVWNHTLLVMKNAGASDRTLTLAALFHDIGKPPTRSIDEQGNTRFFGHESVGATLTDEVLRRWKLPQREIDPVVRLVKNHMRLGHAPIFTESAARRILRDLGEDLDRLLELVDADCRALKPGVRIMDLSEIRVRLQEVQTATPHHVLESPLSGIEIMSLTGLPAGREIGRLKQLLTEKVLEGILRPDDKSTATNLIQEDMKDQKGTKD